MNVVKIKHEKIENLADMESKYFSLVWLARKYKVSDEEGNLITTAEDVMAADSGIGLAAAEEIVLKQFALLEAYPDEVKALISDDDADWAHGFNSGMFAALRFFRTAEEESLQDALDDFPCLDS